MGCTEVQKSTRVCRMMWKRQQINRPIIQRRNKMIGAYLKMVKMWTGRSKEDFVQIVKSLQAWPLRLICAVERHQLEKSTWFFSIARKRGGLWTLATMLIRPCKFEHFGIIRFLVAADNSVTNENALTPSTFWPFKFSTLKPLSH